MTMKLLLYTLFFTIIFCSSLQSQNPIPDFKEGHIKTDQLYGLRKWTEKEIHEMPEGIIPAYSEGGVLVDNNEFYIELDSVEIFDPTGIDSFKMIERKIESPYFLSWGFDWEYNDRFLFQNLLLQDSAKQENIYLLLIKKENINSDEKTELTLNPKYKNEFPNGLPMKKIAIEKIKKKEPYWISLKEWEVIKHNKNLKQIGNIFLGGNNESYWYFEAGYYAWWDRMVIERDYRTLTIRIQEALTDKGYKVEVTGEMNKETKKALNLFREEYGIPLGQFPGEILRALGINP